MALQVGRCRLRTLLKERGITQVDLSLQLNMTEQMLSHYANNKKVMSLARARQIAKALHCQIEDLYTWDNN